MAKKSKSGRKAPTYRQSSALQHSLNTAGNKNLIGALDVSTPYHTSRSKGNGVIRSATNAAVQSGKQVLTGLAQKMASAAVAPYTVGRGIYETLTNHPEWYTNYSEGTKLIGANFGLRKKVGIPAQNQVFPTSTIGRIDIELGVPVDKTGSFVQGVNYAYAKIRAANAGSVNYTPGDLAEYILNVRGIRAALAQLRRARASANNFNIYDSDAPGLLTAVCGMALEINNTFYGIDYDTIRANMANIDNFLTNAYLQVRNLIPLNMPLLERTDWMFSNVFADSDDAKASYYVMTCPEINLFKYDSATNTVSKGSTINFAKTGNTSFALNLPVILDSIDNAIKEFSGDHTNMIIAGDILKAFGAKAFYNAKNYDADVPAPVIYDEYALTQIQNAVLNHTDVDTITVNMTSGAVTCSGIRPGTATTGYNNRNFINWFKDEISPGELLSCSRLVTFKETIANNTDVYTACGFEIAINMWVCVGRYPNGSYIFDNLAVAETNNDLYRIPYLMSFWAILDWAPRFTTAAEISGKANYFDFWDYNNYAEVTEDQVSQYHQIATLSLLYTGNEPVERHMGFKFLD